MDQARDEAREELQKLSLGLIEILDRRDGTALLLEELPRLFTPAEVGPQGGPQRAWELTGAIRLNEMRHHEAISLISALYQHMLEAQKGKGQRFHKGMPLLWIGEAFMRLGFPVHAKRYLMLTLCEDAVEHSGKIPPDLTGSYFRLVWRIGLPDRELRRYAEEFYRLARAYPEEALYPEALLQRVDDSWQTEAPSSQEAFFFMVNEAYGRLLLNRLGDSGGESLEWLTHYLLSCMPGCRTKRRQSSHSTDYDVVCSMEGAFLDFRSELGRYFVCECKDWKDPADFSTVAKFCRVLDSTKAKFGVLFSRSGVTGKGKSTNAEREQVKVYQDRGIVIVVLDKEDLEAVVGGANLIALLRQRYEDVRLDLRQGGG